LKYCLQPAVRRVFGGRSQRCFDLIVNLNVSSPLGGGVASKNTLYKRSMYFWKMTQRSGGEVAVKLGRRHGRGVSVKN